MLSQILGGIGLFLIGMVMTTDGLRALAGDALRRTLLRFTGGPIKALMSGALVTAVVQSSSATTVATIGFVSAGLLTFEQSLGVIFGANLGTTATGWLVALLGLKFSVSTIALPLVGVGALVRLLSRGRGRDAGTALAGFGMIFVGIDILQAGMVGVSDVLTPDRLPGDGFLGRLALLGIGIVLTAIMQSSSAAMATTLTALHAGSISLDQASAMVIGVNIGTTVTAGIAAIGASVAARRTAVAHLFFNVVTGLIAFAMLPLFSWLVLRLGEGLGANDATLSLALFHTVFNVVGIVVLLPFYRRFAATIERLVRDKGPVLTRRLDPHARSMGAVAVEAVRKTLIEIGGVAAEAIARTLRNGRASPRELETLERAMAAIEATKIYAGEMHMVGNGGATTQTVLLNTLHGMEYVERLIRAGMSIATKGSTGDADIDYCAAHVADGLEAIANWGAKRTPTPPLALVESITSDVAERRRAHRPALFVRAAADEVEPADASRLLDTMRTIDEVGYYISRLAYHLSTGTADAKPE